MQIHGEDRVELTILLDESDYRRSAAEARRSQRWQGTAILLPMIIGGFISIGTEQMIGALSIVGTMVLLTIVGLANRHRHIAKLPDWAYGPVTYRVGSFGVEVESAVSRRTWKWLAITEWRKSDTAYSFVIPGSLGVALPRRMLTPQDEAALERVLHRFSGGSPAADPEPAPPAEVAIRAATPDAG